MYRDFIGADNELLLNREDAFDHPAATTDTGLAVNTEARVGKQFEAGPELAAEGNYYSTAIGFRVPLSETKHINGRVAHDDLTLKVPGIYLSDWSRGTDALSLAYSNHAAPLSYGLSFLLVNMQHDGTFDISKYPRSSYNDATNAFFLDLLEPTFGRSIRLNSSFSGYAVGGEIARQFNLGGAWEFGVGGEYYNNDGTYSVRYDNSRLGQEKTERYPEQYSSRTATLYFRRPSFILSRLQLTGVAGISSGDYEMTCEPQNIDPNTELVDRGRFTIDKNFWFGGLGLCYRSESQKIATSASYNVVTIDYSGNYRTPVLGLFLGFLPIFHEGTTRGNGSLRTLTAEGEYRYFFKRLELGASGRVYWTQARLEATGDALMEAGIADRTYRKNLSSGYGKVRGFYSADLGIKYAVTDSVSVSYQYYALMPFLKADFEYDGGDEHALAATVAW